MDYGSDNYSRLDLRLEKLFPELEYDARTLKSFLERSSNQPVVIANAGPTNPGKSTLFNAFLQRPEAFKTADRRETRELKELPWGDLMVLLDTPGYASAESGDDEEALNGIRRSDFVTFVHNVNSGGLRETELELLKKIQDIYAKEFASRVLLICTRTDEALNEEDIERNCKEIRTQLHNYMTAADLKIWMVSPKLYLDGLEMKRAQNPDAEIFFQESHIPELVEWLKAEVTKQGKRGTSAIMALLDKLRGKQQAFDRNIEERRNKRKKRQQESSDAWKETLGQIKPEWEKCVLPPSSFREISGTYNGVNYTITQWFKR